MIRFPLTSLLIILLNFAVPPQYLGAVDHPRMVVFTANINAALDDCGCSDSAAGGLDRIKTLVDSLRQQYPQLLLVDGGDFLSSYSQPALNHTVVDIMTRMAYDAMAVGDQELVEGTGFLDTMARRLPLRVANLKSQSGERWQRFKPPLLKNGLRLFFFTHREAFDFIPLNGLPLTDPTPQWKPAPTMPIIVVFHGSLEAARKFARTAPDVSVILVGHDQRKGVFREGRTVLVTVGTEGETVALVRFAARKPPQVELLPVVRTIPPDPEIRRLVEKFYQSLNGK